MKFKYIVKTYFWLYNIIRNYGPLTLKQINEMWVADTKLSDGKPMIRQTFSRYRKGVEETFGVSIGCDRENRYFIEDNLLSEVDKRDSLSIPAEMMMEFKDRIFLELSPSENIYYNIILEGMCKKVMVEFDYEQDEESIVFHQKVEPCFVKQYGEHWYLIGRNSDGSFGSFALAKIREVRLTAHKGSAPL